MILYIDILNTQYNTNLSYGNLTANKTTFHVHVVYSTHKINANHITEKNMTLTGLYLSHTNKQTQGCRSQDHAASPKIT